MASLAEQDDLLHTIEQLRTEQEALRQEVRQLRRQQQVLQINRSNLLEIQRIAGIADIVVYEIDAMSGQLHCPDATTAVFGVLGNGASIEELFRVIHPEDRERFERCLADAMNDGQPRNLSHRVVLPNGTERVVQHHVKTFVAVNGMPLKTVGLIQDVTERVQVEAELEEALRRAEAATEAKSAFLANMSHEIRTPLNGIMGLARLLQTTALEPSQHEYVDDILTSSDTLLGLINDILDLAKIEAGKMAIEAVAFEIDEMMGTVEVLCRMLGGPKSIDVLIDKDPRLPRVVIGDPLRVRQILTNLVSNAIKFTERGHVAIEAQVRASDEREVMLRFCVRDTGIGIARERLGALFDSFTQADDSTTRKYGGTGLGLAICRHLATLMGGTMGAQSVVGQGSTFWVELSFARAEVTKSQRAPEVGQRVSGPDGLVGAKVLLVEDNLVNRKVAGHMLRKKGLEVDYAHDGVEALRMLEASTYDVVLMDMQMPQMDGYEATRRIRQDERFNHLPIVAMTAHTMAGDKDKCLRAGANDYVSKPIEPARLMELLVEMIGTGRSD